MWNVTTPKTDQSLSDHYFWMTIGTNQKTEMCKLVHQQYLNMFEDLCLVQNIVKLNKIFFTIILFSTCELNVTNRKKWCRLLILTFIALIAEGAFTQLTERHLYSIPVTSDATSNKLCNMAHCKHPFKIGNL